MSINNFTHRFPQYLSKPVQVLWFGTDELILFIFLFTLAVSYGKLMWPVFILSQYFYTRTKRMKPRGFFKHLLYAAGMLKMKNYPDYFEKTFYE